MRSVTRSVVALALSGLLVTPLVLPAAPSVAATPSADGTDPVFDEPPSSVDGDVTVRLDPFPTDDPGTDVTPAALDRHASATQADLLRWAETTEGVDVRNTHWLVNAVSLSVDADVDLREAAAVANVRSVTEAATVSRTSVAAAGGHSAADGDTRSGEGDPSVTYGLSMVGAPEAWETHDATGEEATVAVLDSGVESDHPDIDIAPENFQEFDADGNPIDRDPSDPSPQSHGTHVSGTIAGGNASGTHIGVAPDAELAVGGVLTNCGVFGCSGTFSQIIGGMEWAVAEADADVMSMSLGVDGTEDAMVEPVRNARAAGTLVVAAAGNAGEGSSGSPGNVYDAVGVGAVDEAGTVASFSGGEVLSGDDWTDPPASWPDEYVVPTVAAPGVDVWSAQGTAGYGELSGTSMATPHVAGVVAVVASATNADTETLAETLESTAEKPSDAPGPPDERDVRYGTGVVDAVDAIESIGPADPAAEPLPAAALPTAAEATGGPRGGDTARWIGSTAEGLLDRLDDSIEPLSGIEPVLAPGRQRAG